MVTKRAPKPDCEHEEEDAREIRPDLIRDPRARSRGRTEIAGRIVDETEFVRLRGRPYQRSDGECGSRDLGAPSKGDEPIHVIAEGSSQ